MNFYSPILGRVAPKGREPSIPGDKYNRLTLLEEVPGQAVQKSNRYWLCRCDCGTEKTFMLSNLRTARGTQTQSCGCIQREACTKTYLVEPGHTFGRLTVTSRAPDRNRKTFWNVRCECGIEKEVYQNHLKVGVTTSCGCRRVEVTSDRSLTHGKTNTPTYHSWAKAKSRCTNPNDKAWANYGERGIAMCESWLHSFENFLADMGECPEGLSIDRRDNSKGYEPSNCRWASPKEQGRNKRNNVVVNYRGKNISLAEAVEIAGLNYKRINAQLHRGWSISRALESSDFSDPI